MPKIKEYSSLSKSQKFRRLKQFRNVIDANNDRFLSAGEKTFHKDASSEDNVQEDTNRQGDTSSNDDRQILQDNRLEHGNFDVEETFSLRIQQNQFNDAFITERISTVEKTENELSLKQSLAAWAVECNVPHITCDKLLKILVTQANLDLPLSTRSLVGTPRINNIFNTENGKIFHYGFEKALIDQLRRTKNDQSGDTNLNVNLHVDATPLAKSSKSQFWALSGQIYSPRKFGRAPFIITVYHGFKKATVEELLNHFVEEYSSIRKHGFLYGDKKYTVEIRAVICDSPARSFVTCTKGHNGYEGCGKCTAEGEYVNFRMIFPELNALKRTDESFRNRKHPGHHNGTSPFEKLHLRMVTQFPLDYMHLLCLGIMKKLLLLWIEGKHKAKLRASEIYELSQLLVQLAQYVPREFARKPRTLDEIARFKATEFRVFLLYLGLAVLHRYLPIQYLEHFYALHAAVFILSHPTECFNNNEYAEELLRYFVQWCGKLYGEQNLTYNMHNLLHLAEDVRMYGCLDTFSAFVFENYLGLIKQVIRKGEKPLEQLQNRLTEFSAQINPKQCRTLQYPRLSKPSTQNLQFGCSHSYHKIEFEHFQLSCTTKADNICYLDNGDIMQIKFIGIKDKVPVVIGSILENKEGLPHYPTRSENMKIYLGSQWGPLKIVEVSNIASKAVHLPFDTKRYCFIPLLHTCD